MERGYGLGGLCFYKWLAFGVLCVGGRKRRKKAQPSTGPFNLEPKIDSLREAYLLFWAGIGQLNPNPTRPSQDQIVRCCLARML